MTQRRCDTAFKPMASAAESYFAFHIASPATVTAPSQRSVEAAPTTTAPRLS
jgi:hypothetical protein